MIKMNALGLLVVLVFCASAALADNINGVDFVDISGGSGDTDLNVNRNGYGAVGYNYKISTYEISFAQFVLSGAGSGNEDSWVGTVGSNAPAVRVNFHEAARYANWLTSSNVNVGAYSIDGDGKVVGIMTRQDILDSGDLYFVLPTENEWYRAAYADASGNFSLYANGTGTAPLQGTEANYGLDASGPAWAVTAGAVENNNLTFNMMGNVWEWTETPLDGSSVTNVFRGGSYRFTETRLVADYRGSDILTISDDSVGLRIVAIPEPGTISLMSVNTLGLFLTRSIRRRKRLGQSLWPIRGQQYLQDEFYADQVGEPSEADDYFSVLCDWAKSSCLSVWAPAQEVYKKIDIAFWNRMVAIHERKIVRRAAFRKAVRKKLLDCLDASLERIMK